MTLFIICVQVSWDEMKKGYSKLIAARREMLSQYQQKKEGNWGVAQKNGDKMVKANTDKNAIIDVPVELDPTRSSLSAQISYEREQREQERASKHSFNRFGSFETFAKTREQYVTKKDYERQVLSEQPTATSL